MESEEQFFLNTTFSHAFGPERTSNNAGGTLRYVESNKCWSRGEAISQLAKANSRLLP